MAPIPEYKVLSGTEAQVNQQLPQMYFQGWKPILMTAATAGTGHVMVFVMLEHLPGASTVAGA
jgi:hypothetical protein